MKKRSDYRKLAYESGYNGIEPIIVKWPGGSESEWKYVYEYWSGILAYNVKFTEGVVETGKIGDDKVRHVIFKSILKSVTEHNVDEFIKWYTSMFELVYDRVNTLGPNIKFSLCLIGKNRYKQSVYSNIPSQILKYISDSIREIIYQYDIEGEDFTVDKIMISYVVVPQSVNGVMVSISRSKQLWYEISDRSDKNCIYTSIYTCLNWYKNYNLLVDHHNRIVNSTKFKQRLSLVNTNRECTTEGDLLELANLCNCKIHVYNNIYEKYKIVGDGSREIEIRISNGHASSLIRRRNIPSSILETITEDEIVDKPSKAKYNYISYNSTDTSRDTKIIAWDLETYKNEDGSLTPYLCGLAYYDANNEVVMVSIWGGIREFYEHIKDNISTYEDHTFYAHFGSKFDLSFLLRDVLFYDPDTEILYNKFLEQDGCIISLNIKVHGKVIKFRDSIKLLQSSLFQITNAFNVQHKKIELPFGICNITKDTIDTHKNILIQYHKNDCIGLLECICKFSCMIYDKYKLDITKCYTLASLSRKIVLSTCIPRNILNFSVGLDMMVRKSFYGGRTEAFYLGYTNTPLYMFDFTSMYPSVMRYHLPVGEPVFHEFSSETSIEDALDIVKYGFITVMCKGNLGRGVKPLHCIRTDKLIFPWFDKWTEIMLFTPEIKYGLQLGYSYIPVSGISFQRDAFMKRFIHNVFEDKKAAKLNGDKVSEMINKIILNSSYGFWGIKTYDRESLKVSNKSREYLKYLNDNKLIGSSHIGNHTLLRVINNINTVSNVSIASAITSYGRIILHKCMCDIQKHGGNIYYTDTDSILTDIDIGTIPELVTKYGTGERLGELKNEIAPHESFYETIILGCKMYSLKTRVKDKDKIALKGCKGGDKAEIIDNVLKNGLYVHTQEQLYMGVSDMMRENDCFNLKSKIIDKNIRTFYTKGIVHGDIHDISSKLMSITPLIIS